MTLADGFGMPLVPPGTDPLADLTRALARDLIAAGFEIHDCAGKAPGLAELGVDLDRQRSSRGSRTPAIECLPLRVFRWIDFESCCVGPLEWDCLPARRGHCDVLRRRS